MPSHLRRRTPPALGHVATPDDLERLPDDVFGEIVAGELITSPRPGTPHARATSDLGALIAGPFRFGVGGPGGWVPLDEPRLRLGSDVRVPDLAGWRRERWVDVPRKGPIPIVPDWICEVLSKATRVEDRTVKRDLYAAHGVAHYWLIDPDARTLEIYRLERRNWLLIGNHADDALVRGEPFDAVELDLSLLWEPRGPDDQDDEE